MLMPVSLTNEEKAELVESLVSEFNITVDAAEACLVASTWDVTAAKKVASLNRIQHLLINLRFFGKNPLPHGGLISIMLVHGEPEPEHVIGLVIDGSEYIDEVSPHFPGADFIKAILYPLKQNRSDTTWLSLRQSIIQSLHPGKVDELFRAGNGETHSEVNGDGTIREHNPLRDAVSAIIKPLIDEIFIESVKIEIVTILMNGFQHDNLRLMLRKESDDDEVEEAGRKITHATLPKADFKVQLKGRLIIDPHQGVPVEELREGDTVICDVVDSSAVATEVGKMLGVYRRGVWFPIQGRIISITEGLSGTKRINMVAGRGVYIISSALTSVRVKVSEKEIDSIQRRIEQQREESVRSLLGVLPLALIILGIALALTILLQRS